MEDSIVNTMQKELREFGEDDDKRWEENDTYGKKITKDGNQT